MAGYSPGRYPAARRLIIFFYPEPEIRTLTTHFIDDGKCGLGSGNLQTIVRVCGPAQCPLVSLLSAATARRVVSQPSIGTMLPVTRHQARLGKKCRAFKREIIKVGV